MTRRVEEPKDCLPLTPATLAILLALADRELHGYAIMRRVSDNTSGAVRLGPATLYRSIRQMLQRGWVEESEERPDPEFDDTRRRYYRITEFGRRIASAEVDRLEAIVTTAHARGIVPAAERVQ